VKVWRHKGDEPLAKIVAGMSRASPRAWYCTGRSSAGPIPLERETEMTKPPTRAAAPKAPAHMIETINKIVHTSRQMLHESN
jgi:hypothetical protein